MTEPGLVWCAKSPWVPTIRREHHLTLQAVESGVDVTFVERPADIRAAPSMGPSGFTRALLGSSAQPGEGPGPRVMVRAAPLPGHLTRATAALDAALLRRCVRRVGWPDAVLICQTPWQWPATRGRSGRRVFDYSDDWVALLPPSRRAHLQARLRQIGEEADEIIVVSPHLRRHFPGREVRIVPNGTAGEAIAPVPADPPGAQRLTYVGTLSERFDVRLVAEVLDRLPAWRLDLYGDCQYAGSGGRPGAALATFLSSYGARVAWHGPVPRSRVGEVIDEGDVCIIPNRPERSMGQSSMKLYDFAGRGRPTVGSPGVADDGDSRPPGYLEASTPDEWSEAILSAAGQPVALACARLEWAAGHTWQRRWPLWASAAFGPAVPLAV